jgi:hypothetical protein
MRVPAYDSGPRPRWDRRRCGPLAGTRRFREWKTQPSDEGRNRVLCPQASAFVGAAWRRSDLRNADVQAALCRTAMKNPLRKGNGSRKDLRHQDPGLLPCLSASVGVGLGRLLVRKRRKQRRMHQRLKLRVAILEVHHELWAIGIDRGLVHGRLFNRRGAGFLVHDSRLHDHG